MAGPALSRAVSTLCMPTLSRVQRWRFYTAVLTPKNLLANITRPNIFHILATCVADMIKVIFLDAFHFTCEWSLLHCILVCGNEAGRLWQQVFLFVVTSNQGAHSSHFTVTCTFCLQAASAQTSSDMHMVWPADPEKWPLPPTRSGARLYVTCAFYGFSIVGKTLSYFSDSQL